MLNLYVFGAILSVIGVLIVALRVATAEKKTAQSVAQAATATAISATAAVVQKTKTEEALVEVDKAINKEHVTEQANIDAGKRDFFEKTDF